MIEFSDFVERRVRESPDHLAVIDGVRRMTRAQLLLEARVLGSALVQRGLVRGAAIAFQLPNWHEACVINLAAILYGFKLVPLLPMYREAEIGFILDECDVQALFIPQTFRNVAYPDLFLRAQPAAMSGQNVFVVRGADERFCSYDSLMAEVQQPSDTRPAAHDAVKLVLYTSGSTGKAKGVMHSHATIAALIELAGSFWSLSTADVMLVPSPLGHIGGSMYAFEFPWILGTSAVLMESWEPSRAVELINRERVTLCAGATPFLKDLVKAAQAAGSELPSFTRFICGGASVPPSLIEEAGARFPNCTVSRAYGSTEVPLTCPGVRSRADAVYGAITDGECVAEVRILDAQGNVVPNGEPGEIVARAPQMFLGYVNPQDNEGAFTPDGYFRMGDVGRIVFDRFIEITGRKKDLIIRMGENISPLEIENVLSQHHAIRQIAIVGIPDATTGEAAFAFVVLNDGAQLSLADMTQFLAARGLAKQKFPEHLRLVAELPINSIGKVLKRELQRLAVTAPAAGEIDFKRAQR
jgi:acyl-CoA synthetase (AMP-forming)/AMP-acid ligase II